MSDMLDQLEIIIGKFLDGAASPQERSLLENEMKQNGHAKELFEQMRVLHECSCGVVTHEVLTRGADPADIFERAWQQNQRSFWRRRAKGGLERQGRQWGAQARSHLRFAAGIAAGLLLGLIFQFVPVPHSTKNPTNLTLTQPQPLAVAANTHPSGYGRPEVTPVPQTVSQPATPGQVTRQVNWYVYTDSAGNQWLIEARLQGTVRNAVYGGDL